MSEIKFELEASVRDDLGRGASRRLRQADKIPAVLYGAGEEAVSLTLDHNKTMHALAHEAFYSHILNLKVGDKREKVILKALQRHPAKPRITHIDFLRVRADQKIHMNVPLHFIGEDKAPGVKMGGIFSHLLTELEISCLPDHLPEFISIDVSHMGLNQTLHISEVALPSGVELASAAEQDLPVITIHLLRTVIEESTTAEAAAESTEKPETGEENA